MIDPAALSGPQRAALAAAAAAIGPAAAEIRRDAGSPLALFTGGATPDPFRHYPAGDVYDPASGGQYYFHTHRRGEAGHIHLFLRPKGMPPGLLPQMPAGEADAPSHLVAIGLGADGWPDELFTTNRWVTGEAWYTADAVVAMLPCFRVAGTGSFAPLSSWLSSLVALVTPLAAELVIQRDAAVSAWARSHPGFALEDRGLEITSRAPLDVGAWVAAVLAG